MERNSPVYQFYRWLETPKRCQALKKDGRPCEGKAIYGEAFCGPHLGAGYGLFAFAAWCKHFLRVAAERSHDQ